MLCRWLSIGMFPLLLLQGLSAGFPGETTSPDVGKSIDPGLFGIVGLDPWYTYDADPVNHPDDVNRALLERMASDMSWMGARWIRIEFHPEYDQAIGPGPIDYSKHDWFINDLAPRYGLKVLAVLGSGLIGDRDRTWSFDQINADLDESGSNAYIDLYVERVVEIVDRYGDRLSAVEILNEPNANAVLASQTDDVTKAVRPGHYGEILRRSYDVVKGHSPTTAVVTGGVLFDDEAGASYEYRGRSHDLDWLEAVFGSRPLMSFVAEHGRAPFDAIGVHPYFLDPPEVVSYLNDVRALQERFGHEAAPIWLTEIGRPAEPPESAFALGHSLPSKSERQQAAFLSALYSTIDQRAPFVERIFWFKYEDFPHDGKFNGWGLVRLEGSAEDYGTFANPWPRKFAYAVYQAIAQPNSLPVSPVDPASLPDDAIYFHDTGHSLSGPFLDFWRANDGANRFGDALTEPFDQRGRRVQYFERAKFEHYPEHAEAGWDVQLGHIGRQAFQAAGTELEESNAAGGDDELFFPETGRAISGDFRSYWEQQGGLKFFGYPITPELVEGSEIVQYFERAKFVLTPDEDGAAARVVLEDVGNEALSIQGWYR